MCFGGKTRTGQQQVSRFTAWCPVERLCSVQSFGCSIRMFPVRSATGIYCGGVVSQDISPILGVMQADELEKDP
ncbi:hypothetical protein RRG08_012548 [Elysia crispata]|uniref:Uncharacterized protein n=1 Tax=Elysia crispata TaxID=231223 RepID=A0AAE1AQB0_9GAST|nr:hypothetical protein RRG08_012548 [Elysia crispata]